jgi:hypothetical protein
LILQRGIARGQIKQPIGDDIELTIELAQETPGEVFWPVMD